MKLNEEQFQETEFKIKLKVDSKFYDVAVKPDSDEMWVPIGDTPYDMYMYVGTDKHLNISVLKFSEPHVKVNFEIVSIKIK